MKNSTTRQTLIQEGVRALLARGYDGVGLEEILSAGDVPKGSFYHFFRSKEDFACVVLDAYGAHYSALRGKIFGDATRSPAQRLRRYFNVLERELARSMRSGGCLYGVLAQTAGNRGPLLLERLAKSFEAWEDSLRQVIAEGQKAGDFAVSHDARQAAAFLIDAYEGALIRVKAEGNMAPFRRFKAFALEPLLSSQSAR